MAVCRTRAVCCQTVAVELSAVNIPIVGWMGEEKSRTLYMNLLPGEDPRHPEALEDNTHTRYAGADLYAQCMAEHLKK